MKSYVVSLMQDSQRLIPNYELREDFIRSSPLNMGPPQTAEPWKPKSGLFDNNQFVMIGQTITKPALIDIQGLFIFTSLRSLTNTSYHHQ